MKRTIDIQSIPCSRTNHTVWFIPYEDTTNFIPYEDTSNFNQYRLYTVQYIYIIHDETLLQNHFFVDLRAQCNYSKIVASYRRKITVFLGETQLSNALQSKPGNAFSFMNFVWEKNEFHRNDYVHKSWIIK